MPDIIILNISPFICVNTAQIAVRLGVLGEGLVLTGHRHHYPSVSINFGPQFSAYRARISLSKRVD
jgi:hypothetical protein